MAKNQEIDQIAKAIFEGCSASPANSVKIERLAVLRLAAHVLGRDVATGTTTKPAVKPKKEGKKDGDDVPG